MSGGTLVQTVTSLRHPKNALSAAFACLVGLVATGVLAYLVPVAQTGDNITLQGFVALNRPWATEFIDRIAHLADPLPYAIIGLTLVGVAAHRRRPHVAVAILVLLVLNGVTTQALKQLLAQPRASDWLGEGQIAAAAWPSGHATASMTLGLCAVLASSPAARPTVAAIGALFAISVSYSILALGWHFPSDVIGGFFVASMWTLVAVAILQAWPDHARAPEASRAGVTAPRGLVAVGPGLVGAMVLSAGATAWAARPQEVSAFAVDHPGFMLGAVTIAVLAAGLATALARGMRA